MPQTIQQPYVGLVTVVGECFCYGAALDGEQLVYLDVAGPATSVEAAWAKIVGGKGAAIVPPQHRAQKIPLQTQEGKLKRIQRKVEGLGVHHMLLLHTDLLEPTYAELSTTYLVMADKAQATAKLGAHVQKLVNIAVFSTWHPYLVQQGRLHRLLTQCTCYGGVDVWRVSLDQSAWERLIRRGLERRDIQL